MWPGAFDPCICHHSRSLNGAWYRREFLCFDTIRVSQRGLVHKHPLDNLTWKKRISAWDCARWLSWLVCRVHLSLTSPSQTQPSVQIHCIYRHKSQPPIWRKLHFYSLVHCLESSIFQQQEIRPGEDKIMAAFIFITILSLGNNPRNRPNATAGSLQHSTAVWVCFLFSWKLLKVTVVKCACKLNIYHVLH